MEESVRDLIRRRRSVRTYDKKPLSAEDRKRLKEYMESLKNPFGIPVEFRILDAREQGLSSPVVVGADTYVGVKVPRIPNAELAVGYKLERLILYACSIGLGTVWLAATIDRPAFERAMEVGDNEIMPAVTPIGYPATRKSVRESMMRKALGADERLSFENLFFRESFSEPLEKSEAGPLGEALEMVRLAPSAGNKQPWRVVSCDNMLHFYEKKDKSLSKNPLGDIQKVDMGIALLHFSLMLEDADMNGCFMRDDPHLSQEADMEYIISYQSLVIDEKLRELRRK